MSRKRDKTTDDVSESNTSSTKVLIDHHHSLQDDGNRKTEVVVKSNTITSYIHSNLADVFNFDPKGKHPKKTIEKALEYKKKGSTLQILELRMKEKQYKIKEKSKGDSPQYSIITISWESVIRSNSNFYNNFILDNSVGNVAAVGSRSTTENTTSGTRIVGKRERQSRGSQMTSTRHSDSQKSDQEESNEGPRNAFQGTGEDAAACGGTSARATASQMLIARTRSRAHWEMPENIAYDILKEATGGFDNRKLDDGGMLIASGSFGHVFLGRWNGYRVAVKRLKEPRSQRLSSIRLAKRQFMNELSALISCPPHENIVRLLGVSDDGPELLLAYGYVEGKTLSQHLVKTSTEPLLWDQRLHIAIGIARGIDHIQSTCSPPLIHRDVKSSNVLVARDLTAKLADFGLSTFAEFEDDVNASFLETGSTTVGTRCYMPPEAFKGIFSTRTDVYSFGMILFESVTGLPPYSWSKKTDLATYLKKSELEGTEIVAMADPKAGWPHDVASRHIDLAKSCTELDSHDRPLISQVLRELRDIKRRQRERLI